jgi:colanic acid/amylovoran biosynthesis glycosyltransferase
MSREVRRRLHVVWPHRPRWLAGLLVPAALLYGIIRNPGGSWSYIKKGGKLFGWHVFRNFYLDISTIILQPDLLHYEFGALAVGKMYLPEFLQCKSVVSFRGYDLNFSGLDKADYYQEIWDRADAVHCLGGDLWRRALRRGCSSEKPHAIISPAIDTEVFVPENREHAEVVGIPERPLRLVSLGRLEWKKGYEYALDAVRQLVSQGICCEYRIIGGGEYLGPIAFSRHQMGLDKVVQLVGPQSRPEVITQLLWGDVLIHAAVSEGFCNAVLEAQAMKLPVVCSDADGLPENVHDGETGFVVPRRRPGAMAEKLSLLAQDPVLRQRMGQAGRERVTKYFRLPQQISAFEQFYQQVLAK